MVEVYKCLNNISPPFTWNYLKQKINPHNLRNLQLLKLSKCRTKTFGLNTAIFKAPLLWNKMPNHFKGAKYLIYFKKKKKNRE